MSTIREYDDDEDAIELTGEEAEGLDAAMAEADAHPEWNIPWDEFIRKLRNGE